MVLLSSVMSSCFRLCFFPANPFTIPSVHRLRMHKKKKFKAPLVPCHRNGSKVARYSCHVGIVYSSSIISAFLGVECIKISLEASPSRVESLKMVLSHKATVFQSLHTYGRACHRRGTLIGATGNSPIIRWQIYVSAGALARLVTSYTRLSVYA